MRAIAATLFLALAALASAEENPFRETMTQVSTYDSLFAGNYDGMYSFAELKQYGDFGLGTLKDLDGELVILDGKYLRIDTEGKVSEMPAETTTPFIVTTFLDEDKKLEVTGVDMAALQEKLNSEIRPEYFHAIRIDGKFRTMKTRSVPRQFPHKPLLDSLKEQVFFEHEDIEGTMVGIYCPAYVNGLNVAGYHFHFVKSDRSGGGHVVTVEIESATVTLDETTAMNMLLPKNEFNPGTKE